MSRFLALSPGLAFVLALVNFASAADEQNGKGIDFFEKKIRPVLVTYCYECHSADSDELQGELLLDTREGIRRGGASGHAVVPGNLKDSLLVSAIRFEGDFDMPPDEQLPENVISDLERWIRMGAPDPREGESVARTAIDIDEARKFWSFQPIQISDPPNVRDTKWPRSDIDRFILAGIESKGLHPVADADPAVLVRRVYFDLTGLPPTPQQVDEFTADPSPAVLAELINHLLESPQFGETWGRHWLDVVRYGESTGMERNFTYPYAWRYRDYVIRSFNEDRPFDRFITEQVAGDLLPASSVQQRDEQLIATGMLAMGTKSLNETNKEKFQMDVVDEQIDVTTQAFIGTTASCARCHDHKFDPIPQSEYYSLAGIFSSTTTFYGTGGNRGNRQPGQLLALGLDHVAPAKVAAKGSNNNKARENVAKQLRTARRRLNQLREQAAKTPAGRQKLSTAKAQVSRLETKLETLDRDAQPATKADTKAAVLAMAVQDNEKPSDTTIRIRGEANDRGDIVPRGFLTVLTPNEAPRIDGSTSGRLQYAQWLTERDNPLTSRVAVNRVWQHLFGRGIVPSVNNFGTTGTPPTHPELLDSLALELMDNDWSIKHMIRTIMTSRAYQLSSAGDAKALEIDPDNNLFWRMNQRRLKAEAIRDSLLAASGQLDLAPASGSVVESIGDGDVGTQIRPERFAVASTKRSVYLPIVRGAVPEVLQIFDFPDPSIIYGQREVTTVPTQALYMMNSPFVIEQARHFAKRVLAQEGLDSNARIELTYRLALCRRPTSEESERSLQFITQNAASLSDSPAKTANAEINAWSAFCQALFASSEFRYVD